MNALLDDYKSINKALENGLRPDAVDHVNRIVRELKPDTRSGKALGNRQLKSYVDQLRVETGNTYTPILDVYKP